MHRIREKEKSFENLKILLIHSGGDSRRIPQYSALGKLFSPVPHVLEDGRSSTLFDELIIMMSPVPGRIKEGMLACSGDVLPLFHPLLIEFNGRGAAAVSFKENVQTGKDHGVFLCGNDGTVVSFLHKQSVETLRNRKAVDDSDMVDIDTGMVLLGTDLLEALWSLISSDGEFDANKYDRYVNEQTCLSLYGDFQYPLAEDSTLEQFYLEKAERSLNGHLKKAREDVWNALRPYRMRVLRSAPARFLHFGTSKEILKLLNEEISSYRPLGWKSDTNSHAGDRAAYDSLIGEDAAVDDGSYIERSYLHERVKVGSSTILSCVEIPEDMQIPSGIVMHALKLKSGFWVCRVFGIEDDPKRNLLFGKEITDRVWEQDDPHDLWHARIYPECVSMETAVRAGLQLYESVKNGEPLVIKEHSLCSSFNEADPDALMEWIERMKELAAVGKIDQMIRDQEPVSRCKGIFPGGLSGIQRKWLDEQLMNAPFSRRMRLHYYAGTASDSENEISAAFRSLSETILQEAEKRLEFNNTAHIGCDRLTVKLPLRVNWGGGWSDTPPYCNENGGTVINCAVTLNGRRPISVEL